MNRQTQIPPTTIDLTPQTQTMQLKNQIHALKCKIIVIEDQLYQTQLLLKEATTELESTKKKAENEQISFTNTISELQQKLDQQKQVVEDTQTQLKQAQNSKAGLVIEITQINKQLRELESESEAKMTAGNQATEIYNRQKRQIEELKQTNQKLQSQLNQKVEEVTNLSTQQTQLKNQILMQKEETQNQIKQFNLDLMEKQAKIDYEHKNFLESREELVSCKKEIVKNRQDTLILDQEKANLQGQLSELLDQNKILQNLLQQSESKVQYKKQKLQILKKEIAYYHDLVQNQNKNEVQGKENDQLLKQYLQHQQQAQQELKKQYEQKNAENQKQMKQHQQQIEQQKLIQNEEQKNQHRQRLYNANLLINQATQTHGKLDVCFLLDITSSMDPYKEQTKNCIFQTLQMIKTACNRDTNWGGVCYQDFDELRKLGKYKQFQFTEQSHLLQQWLHNLKCEGGGDEPEDIRGAIKQMCSLTWPSKFKLAILICDAPCHGFRYNGGLADNYPNEDIQDALDLLIRQNIILVGLNFTQKTVRMYDQFKMIYQRLGKQELFFYADLQRVKIEDVATQMSKWIAEASTQATLTNKKGTKHALQEQPAFQHGPTQAVFNQNNLQNCFQFDKIMNLRSMNIRLKVFKVEIKEELFEKKIQQLFEIVFPSDYQVTEEGIWDCIRTEQPFAQGAMKDAFLMKKCVFPNIDLYVIKAQKSKGPYKSINDAILECRSHLISQRLMKKFQNDLETALQNKNIKKKYPAVIYSDILILEEAQSINFNQLDKYWIAERFFNGEFVKYNNNWSYMDGSVTELNKLAQSFSFYTFHISQQNYVVVDVQGVGIYFTDPAIHTRRGKFEQTDMGIDGISMYLVSYKQIAFNVSREILSIMDLYPF